MQTLLEPGSVLSQVLDDSGRLPLIGLVSRIAKLIATSLESPRCQTGAVAATPGILESYLRVWWENRGEREMEDLPQMEPGEIVDRLPALWAADLKDYLSEGSATVEGRMSNVPNRRAVLFIDSYETLWETGATEAEFLKRDQWVGELVKQLPEALWIVCGRQKLRWEEAEADWGKALSQHQLGALPDPAARRFLESCDIPTGQIQDAIVKGSQGVPHYLDLAVDTIQSSKSQVPSFGIVPKVGVVMLLRPVRG